MLSAHIGRLHEDSYESDGPPPEIWVRTGLQGCAVLNLEQLDVYIRVAMCWHCGSCGSATTPFSRARNW